MKTRLTLLALGLLVAAGVGIAVSGVFSSSPPEVQASDDDQCNTCDARQRAKERLREKLKAIRSQEE